MFPCSAICFFDVDEVFFIFFWFKSVEFGFYMFSIPVKLFENTFILLLTGIWYWNRWIIYGRDESAHLMVWDKKIRFYFIDIVFFQEILIIFGWSHVKFTTIGTLRIVITIKALVIFIPTLKTFQLPSTLPFTMSEFLTSYWIRNIWTYFTL